jgi:hypothetical protein
LTALSSFVVVRETAAASPASAADASSLLGTFPRFAEGSRECQTAQQLAFSLAVEVDPDHYWCPGALISAKCVVGEEDPANSSRYLTDLLYTPVSVEAEALFVVNSSSGHITDTYLWYGAWEFFAHRGS